MPLTPLRPGGTREGDALTEQKGGRLAAQAGMLCGERDFLRYLDARLRWETGMTPEALPDGTASELDAAEFIRSRCSVRSRADLDHDQEAASMFRRIQNDYRRWRARRMG